MTDQTTKTNIRNALRDLGLPEAWAEWASNMRVEHDFPQAGYWHDGTLHATSRVALDGDGVSIEAKAKGSLRWLCDRLGGNPEPQKQTGTSGMVQGADGWEYPNADAANADHWKAVAEREASAAAELRGDCRELSAQLAGAIEDRDKAKREVVKATDELGVTSMMLQRARATMGAGSTENIAVAARRVVEERDVLRAKLEAAEKALAFGRGLDLPCGWYWQVDHQGDWGIRDRAGKEIGCVIRRAADCYTWHGEGADHGRAPAELPARLALAYSLREVFGPKLSADDITAALWDMPGKERTVVLYPFWPAISEAAQRTQLADEKATAAMADAHLARVVLNDCRRVLTKAENERDSAIAKLEAVRRAAK